MTFSSDDIVGVFLLKSMGNEHRTPPTPEEEAALLGKEIKLPPVPGSSPEPAEQSTALSASSPSPIPQSNCYSSPKAKESWRGIDANPNHPSRWVCFYLQENDRVPEWWREFQLLICSLDESFGNILAQRIACQQATAFRLQATQLEWDGSWTAPPCLESLEWRDYLPPAVFRGAQDYWVVQAKETVVLTKTLQRCTAHSGMPLGVLCGAVQELHECLTSMIQSGDLIDLEMLDVAKDPVAPSSKGRAPSLMPGAEQPFGVNTPSELSASEPEEAAPQEELTLLPRWRPLPTPGFSLLWVDKSDSLPPGQEDWPMNVPWGVQLDFASLGSIQVTSSLSFGSFCLHPPCSCQLLLVDQTKLLYDNHPFMCPWKVCTKPIIVTWCCFLIGWAPAPWNGVELEKK